jgi:hypothetical protein
MTSFRVLAVLAAAFAFAGVARAAETDVRGSVQGNGWFHTGENALVVDGRVDFEVDVGPVTLGGTYRAYDFGEGTYNPRGIDPVFHLKHRYIEGGRDALFFRGGNYFVTFGRGLTLRSIENVDLEYDTSLDGFITEYKSGPAAFSGLVGEVSEEVTDARTRTYRVRGGRAQVDLGPQVSLAVSGVDRDTGITDENAVLPERLSKFADYVLGVESEAWLGPVSLAGEYAERRGGYYPELSQGDVPGHGTYLSGTAGASWFTLLAEYKNYYRFQNALVNPPTCIEDHTWVLMNRVTHEVNLGDERGFLVEGTVSPAADLQITGGASEARTKGGGLVHWEMFGQIDRATVVWGLSSLAGSWSREYALGRFAEYMTGAIDLEYQAGPLDMVDIDFEIQHTEEPSGETFEAYLTSFACYPGAGVTLSLIGEASSEPGLDRDVWVFGSIRTTVSEGIDVSLGGGTERGGKKCSGGICFTEPEFTGVRLSMLTYF